MSITKKDVVFLDIAEKLSELGTCDRARVGAVLTKEGRCIAWGYNGAPPGMPHCYENGHGWEPQTGTALALLQEEFGEYYPVNEAVKKYGCKNATHAEANVLAFAARQGISTDGATLYVTLSPCATCARLLIAAGVRRVVWSTTYRDFTGSELLERAGIEKVVILPDDRDAVIH